jgi:hypothetical protein
MSKYKTRYFNTIEETDSPGVLVKKSSDTKKIQEEYEYWYALPKELRQYFVKPYSFKLENNIASYYMEEVRADSAGAQLAAGNMSDESFSSFFASLVKFREISTSYSINDDELDVDKNSKFLILEKTKARLDELENTYWVDSRYASSLMDAGVSGSLLYSLLVSVFTDKYSNRMSKRVVLSHGDLTLSNILWDYETDVFKLIDPRGKSYLYMDEYYDLAKLSQSINGRYEDIIHGDYSLDVNRGELSFPKEQDTEQQKIFKDYLEAEGIDLDLLRVYEASLFLSMLPMHLDDPQRIAAFLVNCKSILNNL